MHLTFEIFSLNYQIIHLMADKSWVWLEKGHKIAYFCTFYNFFLIHAAVISWPEICCLKGGEASITQAKIEWWDSKKIGLFHYSISKMSQKSTAILCFSQRCHHSSLVFILKTYTSMLVYKKIWTLFHPSENCIFYFFFI